MVFSTQHVCPTCQGSGKLAEKKCEHCNGKGLEVTKASVEFIIPSEVFDGASMLMEGYGDLPKTNTLCQPQIQQIYLLHIQYQFFGEKCFALNFCLQQS